MPPRGTSNSRRIKSSKLEVYEQGTVRVSRCHQAHAGLLFTCCSRGWQNAHLTKSNMASGSKMSFHTGVWNRPGSPPEADALESSLPGPGQGCWHSIENWYEINVQLKDSQLWSPLPSLPLSSPVPIVRHLDSPFCTHSPQRNHPG